MPEQAVNSIPRSTRMPIRELDGYDMVETDTLPAADGLDLQKRFQGTRTTASYAIVQGGEEVGQAELAFGLKRKEVAFDIAVSKKGHDIGATVLKGLANNLDDRGFMLVTAGIMSDSRPYWEHLAARGDVAPIDSSDPKTQYRVVPASAEPK